MPGALEALMELKAKGPYHHESCKTIAVCLSARCFFFRKYTFTCVQSISHTRLHTLGNK